MSASTLTILADSGPFRGLLLTILVSRAISIVVELQGVLTCWSSTPGVLANSGPFHGLLLTVFRFQSDFHRCRTPRCAYVSVINSRRFGRFWPVSWTITLLLGPDVISMIDEDRGAFMCPSSTLTVLSNSNLFHGLLLTILGSRSYFHSC